MGHPVVCRGREEQGSPKRVRCILNRGPRLVATWTRKAGPEHTDSTGIKSTGIVARVPFDCWPSQTST
ncbi:hypothetical protein ANTQUA_LOCUS1195 [Anthophora quadrimaculata]